MRSRAPEPPIGLLHWPVPLRMVDSGRMHDFDFLFGSWNVANRRLAALFEESDTWNEFPGRATVRPVLDGIGNIDEVTFPTHGFGGVTLRLFDLEKKVWRIYWSDTRTGVLFPAVEGVFRGGRGDFYGDDVHDGAPVRVHFVWSGTTTDTPRWEQRFSRDGGETWETNWIMDLSRA